MGVEKRTSNGKDRSRSLRDDKQKDNGKSNSKDNGRSLVFRGKNGGRGRDRTYDQSIKSRMLYQLSYASRFNSSE